VTIAVSDGTIRFTLDCGRGEFEIGGVSAFGYVQGGDMVFWTEEPWTCERACEDCPVRLMEEK